MMRNIKIWYWRHILRLTDKQISVILSYEESRNYDKSVRCRKCDRLGDIIKGSDVRYCPHCGKAWKVK